MQKAAGERANTMDAKLAEIVAAQRQIGEHVVGFQTTVELFLFIFRFLV